MVGTEYEQAGMIKHGSKMIQAVSNARVPKISLYIGASFGAGNYGMCGWSYQPDFLFAWPNARTGVMAGQSAADTMSEVARVGAARKGQEVPEEMLEQQARPSEPTLTRKKTPSIPRAACSITALLIRAIRERSWLLLETC